MTKRYLVLGVADVWGPRKGLDVFAELAKRLDERYQIVLVGTDANTEQQLPENIISVRRTQNRRELAQLYTAADVFVNPTREEVLGLTNLEALACGTPVVTFASGGSPECIDETCGAAVETGDIEAMQREIERVCTDRPYSAAACLRRAGAFDQKEKYAEYIALYRQGGNGRQD